MKHIETKKEAYTEPEACVIDLEMNRIVCVSEGGSEGGSGTDF